MNNNNFNDNKDSNININNTVNIYNFYLEPKELKPELIITITKWVNLISPFVTPIIPYILEAILG